MFVRLRRSGGVFTQLSIGKKFLYCNLMSVKIVKPTNCDINIKTRPLKVQLEDTVTDTLLKSTELQISASLHYHTNEDKNIHISKNVPIAG